MPATIIDGKAVAASIRQDAAERAARFKEERARARPRSRHCRR